MTEQDWHARVLALEARLDLESGLRASQDRDLSSLAAQARAQTHLIQALAITQADHTETLRQHDEQFRSVQAKLDVIVGMLTRLIGDE